jgi:hypothetical protein
MSLCRLRSIDVLDDRRFMSFDAVVGNADQAVVLLLQHILDPCGHVR